MLAQQLRRLQQCRMVDDIVIATTRSAVDDPVEALARLQNVSCFRGDEHDVLSRYALAAREAQADLIIRVTADCPLIDPTVVDRVVETLQSNADRFDYVSNVVSRTYPRGLDTEAFFRDTLERMNRLASSPPAREHVTFHLLQEQPNLYSVGSVTDDADHSHLRWTVDTPEDFLLVERLYSELDLGHRPLPYHAVLEHVLANPELRALNAHIEQKIH